MPVTQDLNGFDEDPDLEGLLHSKPYLDANHPRHGEAVATATAYFNARHGDALHGQRKASPVVLDSSNIFRSTFAKPKD